TDRTPPTDRALRNVNHGVECAACPGCRSAAGRTPDLVQCQSERGIWAGAWTPAVWLRWFVRSLVEYRARRKTEHRARSSAHSGRRCRFARECEWNSSRCRLGTRGRDRIFAVHRWNDQRPTWERFLPDNDTIGIVYSRDAGP